MKKFIKSILVSCFPPYTSAYERDCMLGFVREHADCSLLSQMPSKKLVRRYNLRLGYINHTAWYILEQYFEGNLVFIQKGVKEEQ